MNTYLLTVPPPRSGSVEPIGPIIDAMLPDQLSPMYSHFNLPEGMIDCPTPMTVSWWRDAPIRDPALILIPWGAESRQLACRLQYLTQLSTGVQTPQSRIELMQANKDPTIEPYNRYIESVSRLIGELHHNGGRLVSAFSARGPRGYGSLMGFTYGERFENWMRESFSRFNKG